MKTLFLADLQNKSEKEIKDRVAEEYETDRKALDKISFLIAYESVSSWGCDSASYFLVRDKLTGALFDVRGSHCSCYGFEDQWELETVELAALKARAKKGETRMFPGGYDEDAEKNQTAIKEFILKMRR